MNITETVNALQTGNMNSCIGLTFDTAPPEFLLNFCVRNTSRNDY